MRQISTSAQRSQNMAAIRGENSRPERLVRSLIHRLGYRFRLHASDLMGTPDIVLPRLKAVIFVHGCFWHMHTCPRGKSAPKANAVFWSNKRLSNVKRDRRQKRALEKDWHILIVWECETRDTARLRRKLNAFLRRAGKDAS